MENLKDVQIYPAQQITAGGETFKRGASIIKREYERQADKLKSTSPEAAKKLRETSAQVCECIENISNMQLLENYIHYFYDRTEYIWDYMDSGRVMLDDPERIFEILDLREQELKDDFKVLLERGQVIPKDSKLIGGIYDLKEVLARKSTVIFTPFPKRIRGIDAFDKIYNVNSRQVINFGGNLNLFESELKAYDRKGYDITIVAGSEERLSNLKDLASRMGLEEKITFARGTLTAGIDFPEEKRCWISENDIFKYSKKTKNRRTFKEKGQRIKSFPILPAEIM